MVSQDFQLEEAENGVFFFFFFTYNLKGLDPAGHRLLFNQWPGEIKDSSVTRVKVVPFTYTAGIPLLYRHFTFLSNYSKTKWLVLIIGNRLTHAIAFSFSELS